MLQPDDRQHDAMSDEKPRSKKRGWAILFVPVLVVIDTVGMLAGNAGQYGELVGLLGLAGFACGGAIGACYSIKRGAEGTRTLSFWIVAFGLIGMTLMVIVPVILFRAYGQ
jgi:hypothetical protein